MDTWYYTNFNKFHFLHYFSNPCPMVPSTTFPNPRRFPQQQEVVKSTCRCMYWFRRLKYCAPCHPVVFAFAPSSCWLRLELFFWRLHELQRRAVGSSKALVVSFGKVASGPDASTDRKETCNIALFRVNCSFWLKKKILRAWCVALHGLIKNVYPIINLHTLSILPWRLRLLAKEISFFPYEIFFQDGITRGDFLPINLIVGACHCFHDEMFDSGSIFT